MDVGIFINLAIPYQNGDLYNLIMETLPIMNGWKNNSIPPDMDVWASYQDKCLYFQFHLDTKTFSWVGHRDESHQVDTIAELSEFLEMVNELGEQFQNIPLVVSAPKSIFQDEIIKTLGIKPFFITEEQIETSMKKVKECVFGSFKKHGTLYNSTNPIWNTMESWCNYDY